MQNGFMESFNGRMRDELLNKTMFRNLAHARIVIAAWAADYDTERPHSALDYQTPTDYARPPTTAIAHSAARSKAAHARRLHTRRKSAPTPTRLRSRLEKRPLAGQRRLRCQVFPRNTGLDMPHPHMMPHVAQK
ncbi:hypothetical protein GCM10010961_29240 [Pseudodonghicola xiamenensis]|uniref:Integrase catalytic domain-containing protein n=1 Tax=Pseudodonghicola xiamenensis TaxID=337702 RepID=A0A8J3HA04_9RHOB|nr:hypothetical protein GCM10010961_29240 [Pseudodonghicola xiamenensis]